MDSLGALAHVVPVTRRFVICVWLIGAHSYSNYRLRDVLERHTKKEGNNDKGHFHIPVIGLFDLGTLVPNMAIARWFKGEVLAKMPF